VSSPEGVTGDDRDVEPWQRRVHQQGGERGRQLRLAGRPEPAGVRVEEQAAEGLAGTLDEVPAGVPRQAAPAPGRCEPWPGNTRAARAACCQPAAVPAGAATPTLVPVKSRPEPRRVVVTGLGVLSPAGTGLEPFWKGLQTPPADRRERWVDDFDPAPWLSPREVRHLDRFTQLAVAAADMAVQDAGGLPDVDRSRAGVHLGTGIGGVGSLETQVGVLAERTHSVGAAARLVADGRCDLVLTGGAESSMTPTTLAAFGIMAALSPSGVSRPLDAARDGFCISEGAAVLEEREAALARGARVYGEVLGAASTCDAHHITAPSPGGSGAAQCMRLALQDGELSSADVRAVNAHGTSTPLNDAAEAAAVTAVFGAGAVPVSSIKGVTGHSLGAAGAVEAASVLLSFVHRELPPTLGTVDVDPALEVDVVLAPRPWETGPTVSNSFGFGGHNGSLVLGAA
jgi:3-oxoacyl-[acyl-carrier-protein] synthase II